MDLVSVLEPPEQFPYAFKETRLRNLQNVIVTQAIAHILEPKAKNITISDLCIPLQENPDLSDYFAEHIKLSSQELMARAAQFSGIESDKPSGICLSMLRDDNFFVEGSKQLADQLYRAMQKTEKISDGDLVVCRYMVGNAQQDEFLAIIKLDPVGAFRNIQRVDDQTGKTLVDLRVDPFIFPKSTNILQKGAYIERSRDPAGAEQLGILLLDKQLKGPEVAKFFYKDFLGVSFVQDPAELTLQLFKCLIDCLNDLRPQVDHRLDSRLGRAIYAIFDQYLTFFDIYAWLQPLNLLPQVEAQIRATLQAELPGIRDMTIDPTLVQAYTRRRSFNGQMGLNFSVPAPNYDTVVRNIRRVRSPGQQDYYEITIHTTIWREGS
jgi:hypothetical protein